MSSESIRPINHRLGFTSPEGVRYSHRRLSWQEFQYRKKDIISKLLRVAGEQLVPGATIAHKITHMNYLISSLLSEQNQRDMSLIEVSNGNELIGFVYDWKGGSDYIRSFIYLPDDATRGYIDHLACTNTADQFAISVPISDNSTLFGNGLSDKECLAIAGKYGYEEKFSVRMGLPYSFYTKMSLTRSRYEDASNDRTLWLADQLPPDSRFIQTQNRLKLDTSRLVPDPELAQLIGGKELYLTRLNTMDYPTYSAFHRKVNPHPSPKQSDLEQIAYGLWLGSTNLIGTIGNVADTTLYEPETQHVPIHYFIQGNLALAEAYRGFGLGTRLNFFGLQMTFSFHGDTGFVSADCVGNTAKMWKNRFGADRVSKWAWFVFKKTQLSENA